MDLKAKIKALELKHLWGVCNTNSCKYYNYFFFLGDGKVPHKRCSWRWRQSCCLTTRRYSRHCTAQLWCNTGHPGAAAPCPGLVGHRSPYAPQLAPCFFLSGAWSWTQDILGSCLHFCLHGAGAAKLAGPGGWWSSARRRPPTPLLHNTARNKQV